ncbi:MAG: hypothetical protein MZV49_10250 [Rhodopseudomonas palustris]|nr:hypothetical protein [Rhodopseudomonas palustris]
MTKREIRAVTLSSLAPRGNELLWDIGAGSGAIGIEWLLADAGNRAIGIEARADRLQVARDNAAGALARRISISAMAAPCRPWPACPRPMPRSIGGGGTEPGLSRCGVAGTTLPAAGWSPMP